MPSPSPTPTPPDQAPVPPLPPAPRPPREPIERAYPIPREDLPPSLRLTIPGGRPLPSPPAGGAPATPPVSPPPLPAAPTRTMQPVVPVPPLPIGSPPAAPALKPLPPSALPPIPVQDPLIPRFTELDQFEVDPATAQLLPRDFCEKYRCCILGTAPADPRASIAVGMVEPTNDAILSEIVGIVGRRLHPIQLNDYEVRTAIKRGFGLDKASTGRVLSVSLDYARKIGFEPTQSASDILDDLLSVAIQYGASDIHLETYGKDVDLRFRKNGILRQILTPCAPDNVKKVISRLKVLCNLDIAAKPQPMDGRFSARYLAEDEEVRTIHFRVSIVPTPHGEDCVLRLMDPAVTQRGLVQLGVPPAALHSLRTLLRCPAGLLLVTGPTGSGKTTTLYALLRETLSEEVKVCTVEDPIEYAVPKVNQFEVDESCGFADYARALLRHDPDVIMIGEIRDEDTAQVAVRAASTGHLVLSTVHTDDAIAAVTRMRMLGVEDELLSTTLLGVTAQRLLRRNCVACKVAYAPARETITSYYQEMPKHPFLKGKGCKACSGTGFTGRFGIFEVFVCDDEIAAAIGGHAPLADLRARARERGFVPLARDALERVRAGETTLEEVERSLRPIYYV